MDNYIFTLYKLQPFSKDRFYIFIFKIMEIQPNSLSLCDQYHK